MSTTDHPNDESDLFSKLTRAQVGITFVPLLLFSMWGAGVTAMERYGIKVPAVLNSGNIFGTPLVILSVLVWLTFRPWRGPRTWGRRIGLPIAAGFISAVWVVVNLVFLLWLHLRLGGTL